MSGKSSSQTSGAKPQFVRQRITLTGLVAIMAVSTDLYLPAIPQLIEDLGANISEGQMTLSIFLAGFAIGQLFYGAISDRYGRKPVLYIGLGIYLAATIGCTIANNIEVLLASRFVQGLGGASGPVLARAMVVDTHHRLDAARIMASIAGTMALVPALAPIVGSWLLYFAGWRSHFVVLLVLSLVIIGGVTRLEESCKTIGTAKFRPGNILSQFPLCFANRCFTGFTLCGGAAYAAMFCYISTSSFLITGMLGLAPEFFGYTFMVVVLGFLSGAMASSRLVNRIGVLRVLGIGQLVALSASALLLLMLLFEVRSLVPLLLAFFLVFMAGGFSLAVSQMGAISEFPRAAGSASSVFGFVQIAFASALGYVVGLYYDNSLLPTATGVIVAALISAMGYMLIRKAPVSRDQAENLA